jgi:hypothetical protein
VFGFGFERMAAWTVGQRPFILFPEADYVRSRQNILVRKAGLTRRGIQGSGDRFGSNDLANTAMLGYAWLVCHWFADPAR